MTRDHPIIGHRNRKKIRLKPRAPLRQVIPALLALWSLGTARIFDELCNGVADSSGR
jgi:hypothetical protein